MDSPKENQIRLQGWLDDVPEFSHTMFGETFYACHIHVPRLSGFVDVLPVTVSQRLMSVLLGPGAWIEIEGQLRSYNKAVDGVNRLILTVFALGLSVTDDEDAFNEVKIVGNLCKPPIFRTTPFLREITDLLVAVNRPYQKSDYIPCITWGRTAHFGSELQVGARVEIIGRMQSREYKKLLEDGTTCSRTAFEVSVNSLSAV